LIRFRIKEEVRREWHRPSSLKADRYQWNRSTPQIKQQKSTSEAVDSFPAQWVSCAGSGDDGRLL